LIEQTPNRRQRKIYDERLQALRRSANKAKAQMESPGETIREIN
jgi:hypothetical protein